VAPGIFIGFGLILAIACLYAARTKKQAPPSQFALAQDMRRFAHGFYHATAAEQTERIDIFRETAATYRRQGLSSRQYEHSAALLEASLEPEEQHLLRTVMRNFVTGD